MGAAGVCLTLAFGGRAARAQTFAFELPWDDSSATTIDASDLNPAPLTAAQRVSVKDGHFFDQSGRRVRFLGTNFVASANFAKPEDAGLVAARLHKFGFNIVRLHHMDASWSNPSIFGFDHDGNAGPNQVAPQSLELLDNLIGQFKRNGIYVDLNLHVSRQPMAGEGFPDAGKLPELGKVTAYFDPQFIALQKDYARQILSHVNPHTGLKWADDPTVALVELNNEDTLVGHAWDGSLQAMPPHYRDILARGWNTFLRARYPSDAALRGAWQTEPLGPNLARNARFDAAPVPDAAPSSDAPNAVEGWTLEQSNSARGALSVAPIENQAAMPPGAALRVAPEKLGDADWQLQLRQTGLTFENGRFYTVSFWARADEARSLSVYTALDQAPWTQTGGNLNAALTPQWKPFRFVFRAHDARADHNRLSFGVGSSLVPIELADVQIQRGAVADVAPDWSLAQANFDLPTRGFVPAQAQDWADYLAAVEKSYVDTMTDTIKNEIGYKGLVCCSQASYGGFAGIAREARTDWIDMHTYWQHPNFPGKAWDASNWNIPNTAMTDDEGTGTLLGLASHRVAGKPFTVTEYNHAAPNDFASETVPLILGYAAAQDWDGVFLFDYNGDRDTWNPGKIRGYFDVDSDANKMAFLPSMARVFLGGDIASLRATTTLTIPRDQLVPLMARSMDGSVYNGSVANLWRRLGLTRDDLLDSRLQIKLAAAGSEAQLERSGPRAAGQWKWSWKGGRGVVSIDAPQAKGFVGRVGDSFVVGPLQAGALTVSGVKSSNQWAALTLVARDGQPISQSKQMVLTALNRAENQNMKWNAERTSVGNNWGQGPTQIEVPAAHVEIQTDARVARVFQLSPTGARGEIQFSQLKNGVLSFDIGPDDKTVWWEIATN